MSCQGPEEPRDTAVILRAAGQPLSSGANRSAACQPMPGVRSRWSGAIPNDAGQRTTARSTSAGDWGHRLQIAWRWSGTPVPPAVGRGSAYVYLSSSAQANRYMKPVMVRRTAPGATHRGQHGGRGRRSEAVRARQPETEDLGRALALTSPGTWWSVGSLTGWERQDTGLMSPLDAGSGCTSRRVLEGTPLGGSARRTRALLRVSYCRINWTGPPPDVRSPPFGRPAMDRADGDICC